MAAPAAAPVADGPELAALPSVGDDVFCRWTDNEPHRCQIIERRPAAAGRPGEWEFYVHYHGMNRRLDEWVAADRILSERPAAAPAAAEQGLSAGSGDANVRKTRNMKRKNDELNVSQAALELDRALEKDQTEHAKVKNIHSVVMGPFEIDTWYFSPYPDEFAASSRLFICEYTLKYMSQFATYQRHVAACTQRAPPGREIYRAPAPASSALDGLPPPTHLTVFEVDGRAHKVYAQCLCLLAKLFLDHKTLYYDVDPFLLYVLCEMDEAGHHIVGYFSKEKHSAEGNNLACILVLPPHQRKGYGKLLISLAYQLSIREGRTGSPEKPLSDLGQVTFRSYWTEVLLDVLARHQGNVSIKQLSTLTAIKQEDVVSTLQSLNLVRYWKGQHVVSVNPRTVEEHVRSQQRKSLMVDPQRLRWAPPTMLPLQHVASGGGGGGAGGAAGSGGASEKKLAAAQAAAQQPPQRTPTAPPSDELPDAAAHDAPQSAQPPPLATGAVAAPPVA